MTVPDPNLTLSYQPLPRMARLADGRLVLQALTDPGTWIVLSPHSGDWFLWQTSLTDEQVSQSNPLYLVLDYPE